MIQPRPARQRITKRCEAVPKKKVITWGPLLDRWETEADIRGLSRRTLDS